MTNVIGTALVFFILLIAGYVAIGQLVQSKSITLGNCNWNGTDANNCSLSNSDYLMINSSQANAAGIFTTFGNLNWLTGLALVLVVLLTMIAIVKK